MIDQKVLERTEGEDRNTHKDSERVGENKINNRIHNQFVHHFKSI